MLFLPFKPMEPVSHPPPPPSGPHFLYQVKWDGVRIIAHVSSERVMLHNRKLRDRTHHYPELARLSELVSGNAVLDGEVVALKNGRPNFPLVLERDLISTGAKGRMKLLTERVPVFYLVFDLVYHNGEDLTGMPLENRLARLREILHENDTIRFTESFEDGGALFTTVAEKQMEGILAKETKSLYFPGKKNSAWLKVKVRRQQLVAIGGFTVRDGKLNSLLAGAYYLGKLIYVGRVSSGLSHSDLSRLDAFLRQSVRTTTPFTGSGEKKGKIWVEPRLVALIDFQEWTDDMRMRSPVIKGFTQDKPEDCVLE
jgi:bifunctional non-homologous end joining protein LigD